MFKLSTRQQQTTQKVSNYNKFLPLQWQFMNSKQTEKKLQHCMAKSKSKKIQRKILLSVHKPK